MIPGVLGPQHICWRNPTHTIDGYELRPPPADRPLQSVKLITSVIPIPPGCDTPHATEINGWSTCPEFLETEGVNSNDIGTITPGATLCADVNLPEGINYVVTTATDQGGDGSKFSNVKVYDVPPIPPPPTVPQPLDPMCWTTPPCTKWLGQTLHTNVGQTITLRWNPSPGNRIEGEVYTWPAGVRVLRRLLVAGDGTLAWKVAATGKYSSQARMCTPAGECSAWVSTIAPNPLWVYVVDAALPTPAPTDEPDDSEPVPDDWPEEPNPQAAPPPPLPQPPVCLGSNKCDMFPGDTAFGQVNLAIQMRKVVNERWATVGEVIRFGSNLPVARRTVPPGVGSVRFLPDRAGRFYSRLQHCEVNPIYPGAELRCSGWIDSLTPPTHWQYVIDAGTATPQDDGQPDETMDPVEECDTEFPEGDECVDENDDSITYTVSDLTDEEDPHERGKEPIE